MICNCLPIHLINIPFNQISEVNDIWNKSDEVHTVINTAHSHVTGLCDEVGGGHYHQPPVMVVVPGSCQLSRTECPLSQDTSGPGLTL